MRHAAKHLVNEGQLERGVEIQVVGRQQLLLANRPRRNAMMHM